MSYIEIQNLFIEEIKKTPEWQESILLSNFIKNSIVNPGVQMNIIYNFTTNDINIDIFKLAFKIQFNFENNNISASQCVINMKDFLN